MPDKTDFNSVNISIAEIDAQRSLASFRQIIILEMASNVRMQSPFIRECSVETFGVDEIGSKSIVREQLKHSIFASQANRNDNLDG